MLNDNDKIVIFIHIVIKIKREIESTNQIKKPTNPLNENQPNTN